MPTWALTKKKLLPLSKKLENSPRKATSASNTLFLMSALRHLCSTGNGANTKARIRTSRISILALPASGIKTEAGSTSKENAMKELKLMAGSWLKTFLAAALATYLAVGLDVEAIGNAALAAVLPSIINWLNPSYQRYGRVK